VSEHSDPRWRCSGVVLARRLAALVAVA